MVRLVVPLALIAIGCLAAPAVTAHTTYLTPDGQYRVVVGNLNEPVTTYTKTGLDLRIMLNTTAREAVATNPGNLTATLVAPDGTTTMTRLLQGVRNTPGSYTFDEPYYLTEPGQYVLRLAGHIEGTAIDASINVAGPVDDMADRLFPERGSASPAELQQRVDALEADLTALRTQMEALRSEEASAPSAPVVALLAVLAVGALLARRTKT